ncbi:MAG: NTP transferase domain-containing protein [Oscillospiraceae bacterium]|nr:NTP transferase domain-containing protein [Oscillospiraceae bacterium]
MDKTLVVMAAGLGSRYGGVKQMERLGPDGEILMEYAIYDALAAGFSRLVLIIKPHMLEDIRELFGDRIERSTGLRIGYAFQTPDRFTEARPEFSRRQKPFGTVHCVLCARELLNTPFAVMNADDYYGREAFEVMSSELDRLSSARDAAMVAYKLKNTVSPFGTVTRGVCRTEGGVLKGVTETYKIKLFPDGSIRSTEKGEDGPLLEPETPVSMNLWGFHPDILGVMDSYFADFLGRLQPGDEKSECLLPTMVGDLTDSGNISVSVLSTSDKWFGLTYKEDKPDAVKALSSLHESGVYPPSLWNK